MKFDFVISPHEYEAGSVFDDAPCYGAYIEVGSAETYEWFRERGFEGNGYTILALVDSLCRLEPGDDAGGRMATECLLEQGYRHIGHITGPLD
jgi:hypothetical protein